MTADFKLGRAVITPGAIKVLERLGISPLQLLARHQGGDWGELSEADRAANNQALKDGSRIFSSYDLPEGEKIWVITEAEGDSGDRASTCILLPEDY